MARYFFDVQDGRSIADTEGTDLSGLMAARLEAVALAGRRLLDNPAEFWKADQWSVEVKDHTGLVLFCIHVEAVDAPALMSAAALTGQPARGP